MAGDFIRVEGTIIEQNRGDLYYVDVDLAGATRRVLARPAGRLVKNRIRLTIGDRVSVDVSPFDLTRGRIVYRGQRRDIQAG